NGFPGSGGFLVAEFRVPDYAVTLDTDQPAYVNGATIGATVQADFFFGAHLGDAALAWQVNTSPYTFAPTDRQYSGYSFNDFDYAQPAHSPKSPVATGSGRTDAQGAATFSMPAGLGDYPSSERFSLTATITDQNNQQISASKEVIVHHAADYVGVKTEQYVTAAGDPVNVDVVTVDTTGRAAPGVSVEAMAYLRTWDNKTRRQPDGSTRYISTVIDTLADTHALTTGADGKATYSFTPAKGGQYRIVVAGHDVTGNSFQSSTSIWVTSHDFVPWQVQQDNTVKLVADKTEYQPGDVAHVLVPAPFVGATGLVTIERGRILSSRVQPFTTNSTVVDVPITSDMEPTVYLSVSLVKPGDAANPPDFRAGWAKLSVSPAEHTLNVTLTPDRTKLGPGDTVTVAVQTTDNSGQPAPAEVSLALVDEAVLSLADDRSQAIFPSYWSQRPLGVASGSSLNISVNSQNSARQTAAQRSSSRKSAATAVPAPPPPAPAATAAAAGAAQAPAVTVRTNFQNTAYWKADVTTDAVGKATVSIKLPDNLTTWRLAAKGITVSTAVGEGQATILTQRDVVVRAVAPRFFTAGDQTQLGALVTNRTDAPLDVDVTLAAENLSVAATTQRITVPPGQTGSASWDAVANDGPPVKLTLTAQAVSGQGDAVQLTLPVNLRSSPETVASSGIVSDQTVEETVQIPGFARQDKGSIDLAINASLVGVLHQASLVLEAWCNEPTDVTAARLLSRVGEWQAAVTLNQPLDVQAAHSATAAAAIKRLSDTQSNSGAWCWWAPCSYQSPEITARVLYALGVAREAGFTVDPNVLSRGVRYLGAQYDMPSDVAYQRNPDVRAFWLLAMSQAGGGSRERDDALEQQRDRLGGSGMGSLLAALLLDGAANDDPEVRALAGDIASTGIYSAAGSHWEDENDLHPGYANSTEATSLVLLAMLRLDPTQPLPDGAMRWLANARTNGYWRSTVDTAIAVSAVSAFVAARETPIDGTAFSVDVNGFRIAQGDFSNTDPGATIDVSTPLGGLPTDTPLPVDINRQGSGQLYYSLYLHYFAPTDEISARSNGLTISHEILPENGDDAVNTVKAGDLVRVRVTVAAPTDLQFIQVDDFLPAGLEAIDSSLKTTDPNLIKRQQQDLQNPQLPANQPGSSIGPSYRRYFYYYNPFDHVEVRDDRVSLFATSLSRGVHEYIYYARATTPGTFMQPPVVAVETDFPDIFARSDSNILTVTP
ncbi:MAG: alpha-2-macroglobulin family protein, partial [Dehalococcoidia bacterium]